jgi:serine/threonine-protein kinase
MGDIGNFEIIREIGRGAMGVVYLAQDLAIGRKVALKTIEVNLLDSPEQAPLQHALLEEARLAGNLAHPNIVTIHQIGKHKQLLYVVMEFVAGGSLDSRLQPGRPAPMDWSLAVLSQVASALDAAHAAQVVHRDIKPSNILITLGNDQVKVADFGLARAFAAQRSQSMVAGTPSFMSPEQVEGRPLDGRSDQFALGILAYLLFTGRLPFLGESMMALAFQIVTSEPPAAHVANPALPAGLSAVISRALAKQREGRYPSCGAFVEALRGAIVAPPAPPQPSQFPRRLAIGATAAFAVFAGAVTLLYLARSAAAPASQPRAEIVPAPTAAAAPVVTSPPSAAPPEAVPRETEKPVAAAPPPPTSAPVPAPAKSLSAVTPTATAPSPAADSAAVREASMALQVAVRDGAPLTEMQALLARGASVRGDQNQTPLYLAVHTCREDTARLLLSHGADPNALPAYGFLPLVGAIKGERYGKPCPNRAELVSLLLTAGARADAAESGAAVAAAAAGPEGLSTLRLLIERGAKAQAALGAAVSAARTHSQGETDCYADTVAFLLSRGATPDGGREALLQKASSASCVNIVQMLLASGAKADRLDEEGRTALHVVASLGYGGRPALAMGQALLRAGADPNLPARSDRADRHFAGATPLLLAATAEPELFALLLENKGDPNRVDAAGRTCLHVAVRGRREKIVKLLLAAGAKSNIRDRDGRTPLGVARSNFFPASEPVVKMLLAANAPE